MPYQDNCFWFAEAIPVDVGDWVFVYTGQGTPRTEVLQPPYNGKLHIYYWGRQETMFFHPSLTPIVFRLHDHTYLDTPPFMIPKAQGSAATVENALLNEAARSLIR